MNKRYMDKLMAACACVEAREWAATQETPQSAWDACERGDWMLWWCGKMSGEPDGKGRKRLVLAACDCARLALKCVKVGDDRPLKAIEAAERWANGDGTIEEARSAAAAAAYSAYSAYSAYAAAAAYSAYAAAAAAAYSAYSAYAAAAAAAAAAYDKRKRVLAECADIVRKHYPKPPMRTGK